MELSVIIPTYNDTSQLKDIVKTINDTDIEHEILIVDDGSNEENKKKLGEINNAKLIVHKTNRGKTAAMKTGFKRSTGDYILFLDADIKELKPEHIEKMAYPVIDKKWDISIACLDRHEDKIIKYVGISKLIRGQRLLPRHILERNQDMFDCKGYAIELKMNERLFHKYNIGLVFLDGTTDEAKMKKYGLEFVKHDLKMLYDISKQVHKLGIPEIFRQISIVHKAPKI